VSAYPCFVFVCYARKGRGLRFIYQINNFNAIIDFVYMTIQQLEYIVALDTYRRFVAASEACFVTQPTLTIQVKKLEEEMGGLIFDRGKSPIQPTPLGKKVIAKAREVLTSFHQLEDMVKDEHSSLKGNFKLAVIPTLAPYLLPLFLKHFTEKYPEAHFQIHEMQSEDIIHALKQGTLDLAILVTPLNDTDIREIPMFQEPFLVYTSESHAFYKKKLIKSDEVTPDDLWLLNEGHCFRNQVLNICHNMSGINRQMGFSYESGSIETLKNMVNANLGYTLVPELAVLNEKNNPKVKRFVAPEPTREVSIVVHKGFSKETLLEKLREEVIAVLPQNITTSRKFKKIDWR
jgi:LysR family hydrogen peroxide-inducible transcriptional activator